MAKSFMDFLISIILVGLVAFSLIAWTAQTQQLNNVNNSILSNQLINTTYSKLEGNLTATEQQAQAQRESFEKDEATTGIGTLLFGSLRGAFKVFGSTIVAFWGILGTVAAVLGIPTIVLGTISAIIVVAIILLSWRVLKVGE